ALELIKRGHRLVTDDAVDIREIDGQLIGTSPKITIGMLEVRGIGIIVCYLSLILFILLSMMSTGVISDIKLYL
ncbi:HPr kinase/phosphorylase, partial [human gut metagenome]